MSKPENPSAFPSPMIPEWSEGASGMSLRDWFAGQAITMIIHQCSGDAAFGYPEGIDSMEQMFAVKSYAIADAMLAERSKV